MSSRHSDTYPYGMAQGNQGPQTILHEVVLQLRQSGSTAVSLEQLDDIATKLAPQLSAHELERQKTLLPLQFGQRVEQFRATMEAGQTALKTAIAINGGAAAALLAFLGNLAAKQVPAGPLLPVAMLAFFGGVFFAAASLGARYLTQLRAVEDRTKVAIRYNNTAIVLGLVSLFAFCGGGILAFLGLR